MRPRRLVSLVALLLAFSASPAMADGLHLWLPAGYEGEAAGVFNPETKPADVARGWPVIATLDPALCRVRSNYTWSIEGTPIEAQASGTCRFTLSVPTRGPVRVSLSAARDGATRTATADIDVEGRLIVTIGDSIASGEGNPDVPGFRRAEWQDRQCHRSAQAAPALAAAQIQQLHPTVPITFVSVACSGATVADGLAGNYSGIDRQTGEKYLRPQLDVVREIAERRPIDALVISIGANDMHFGDVIAHCLTHPIKCFDKPITFAGVRYPSLTAALAASDGALPARYAEVAKRLEGLPISRVYLMQYFDPTIAANGKTCGHALIIRSGLLRKARELVLDRLDQRERDAAGEHGWTFVTGARKLFARHGYCVRGAAGWVVQLGKSFSHLSSARTKGTMHPNAEGHRQLSAVIKKAVGGQLFAPPPSPPRRPTPTPGDGDMPDGTTIISGIVAAGSVATLGGLYVTRRRKVNPSTQKASSPAASAPPPPDPAPSSSAP